MSSQKVPLRRDDLAKLKKSLDEVLAVTLSIFLLLCVICLFFTRTTTDLALLIGALVGGLAVLVILSCMALPAMLKESVDVTDEPSASPSLLAREAETSVNSVV